MDQQTYIHALNNRAIVVDSDTDGVLISVHLMGGHAMCTISHDAARELINALKCIVGDDNA